MALTLKFYKEIFEMEQIWMSGIESNVLNAFYLPEMKRFYCEKINILDNEANFTGNELIKQISVVLKNILRKINFLIEEDKRGNLINFMELSSLFLTSRMVNDMTYINAINLSKISKHKSELYSLRKQINNNDDLDDDFYYEDKKKTA